MNDLSLIPLLPLLLRLWGGREEREKRESLRRHFSIP